MVAKSSHGKWLALLVVMVLLLAACGGGGEAPQTGEADAAGEASVQGDIVADGSSTVAPITQAAAEEFMQQAENVRVSVGTSGTGGGFEKFCNGETDISNASRPIRDEELAACKQKGIEFIELPVALDGIALVANTENDWVDCLTVAELEKMWEPAAEGKIMSWDQIRQGFPSQPLELFGPGTDSGTFDFFTDEINGEEGASRGDYQQSEDDNVLVQGVIGSPNALGYFGYAYYQANQEQLRLLGVDSGDGKCVKPSPETVNNGTYKPLSRPLFIYVRKESAGRPEVKAFVQFLLSKEFAELIQSPEVGYVALTDQQYQDALRHFQSGTTGTLVKDGKVQLDQYGK